MRAFYNEAAFQYAIDLLEIDPYHAKERFEEYIEMYPKDYYARAYYAITLTRLGMFTEAKEEYDYITIKSQNDTFYNTRHNNINGFKYNLLVVKIKLLAYEGKYLEILDLINENKNLFNINDLNFITYYCRIKGGLFTEENVVSNGYRFMQTYNYSEELFREHIKKHLYEYNIDIDEVNPVIFSEGFPIDKIIDEIKKYIPSDKKTCPGYFDDVYYFKYDNCGTVDNKKTNIFAVITYSNTREFITMYPVLGYERIQPIDLNYLKEFEVENTNVKRLSQIEKFNKRFNRK